MSRSAVDEIFKHFRGSFDNSVSDGKKFYVVHSLVHFLVGL